MEEALRRVMEPIWEPTFSADSYGFRPERSAHDVATRIFDHLTHGYPWVVLADVRDYLGSIDQQLLIAKVAERISDDTVLEWVHDMLRGGVIPHGGVGSLLVNIYLDPLDQAMTALPSSQFLRYTEHWCALAHTQDEAEDTLQAAEPVLDALRLTRHPETTRIVDVRNTAFDFLGFTFTG